MEKKILEKRLGKIRNEVRKTGEPLSVVGSDDYGGIAGTFSVGSKMMLLDLMDKSNYQITGFIDLGSGTGEVVFSVAAKFDDILCVGVEVSKMIHNHVTRISEHICSHASIKDTDRVQFLNKNILNLLIENPNISHIFSFATGMSLSVFEHIVDIIITSSFVKHAFIVYRTLTEKEIPLLFKERQILRYSKHRIRMAGSGQMHTMWSIEFY